MKGGTALRLGLLGFAVAIALVIGAGLDGTRGLLSCGAGALFALGECWLSRRFVVRSRDAEGFEKIRLIQTGILVGFITLVAAVVAVVIVWRDGAAGFSLTAVGVYTVHRVIDGLTEARRASAMVTRRVGPPSEAAQPYRPGGVTQRLS